MNFSLASVCFKSAGGAFCDKLICAGSADTSLSDKGTPAQINFSSKIRALNLNLTENSRF